MTTPATMNSILDRLRERYLQAASTAETSRDETSGEFWSGYADALSDTIQEITGEKPEAAPRAE